MEERKEEVLEMIHVLDGFAPVSSPPLPWKSVIKPVDGAPNKEERAQNKEEETPFIDKKMEEASGELSERRKALFEPLEPIMNVNGKRESLLPPPDFESASYPRGWLVGKKRKLVNVDVVESMRRIAVQEMNRKDREIDGLNEQLEEDSRCLEHIQVQLLQEKSKRCEVERDNAMLQDQVSMLMDMLQQNEEQQQQQQQQQQGTDAQH